MLDFDFFFRLAGMCYYLLVLFKSSRNYVFDNFENVIEILRVDFGI